jgi:D-psicose/D-tagatose/L-ribulose 3-epimerase
LGPDADPSSDDPAVRAQAQETLTRAIETAALLGSTGLAGVVAAPWGVFDPARKVQRAKRSAETLHMMQDCLQQHNVTLGIEGLNRFEGDLTSTASEACLIRGRKAMKCSGAADGLPSTGSRA